MTLSELYRKSLENPAVATLDFTDPAFEILLLIEFAFGIDRSAFWMNKDTTSADPERLKHFDHAFQRWLREEPLAYILGEKEFYSRVFSVDSRVLIPRPETEILVEKALAVLPFDGKVIEIGSGSGNIAITLACESHCHVTAVEKEKDAVQVLEKNIAAYRVSDRVRVIHADRFLPPSGSFDMLIANPPYVRDDEWDELPRRVREYEPRSALVAGPTGLEIIETIILGARQWLYPKGHLLLEIGYDQQPGVKELLESKNFEKIRFYNDYSGIQRVVHART